MVSSDDGWSFETLYNMPVFLRNYYIRLMIEKRQRDNGRMKGNKHSGQGVINGPAITRK